MNCTSNCIGFRKLTEQCQKDLVALGLEGELNNSPRWSSSIYGWAIAKGLYKQEALDFVDHFTYHTKKNV